MISDGPIPEPRIKVDEHFLDLGLFGLKRLLEYYVSRESDPDGMIAICGFLIEANGSGGEVDESLVDALSVLFDGKSKLAIGKAMMSMLMYLTVEVVQ